MYTNLLSENDNFILQQIKEEKFPPPKKEVKLVNFTNQVRIVGKTYLCQLLIVDIIENRTNIEN